MPYLALCVLIAVVGQFGMEVFGVGGERDSAPLVARLSLGLAIVASTLILVRYGAVVVGAAGGFLDLKRRLRIGLDALPQARHAWPFAVQTAALTFAIGAMAHMGERAPLLGHDAIGWLLCALIVTIIAAIIVSAIVHRLPHVTAAIATLLLSPADAHDPEYVGQPKVRIVLAFIGWTPTLFNRPPPAIQL